MNGEHQRLGDFMFSRRTKGDEGLPTLSVTLDRGLVPRDSLERKTDTNLEAGEHLRVLPGDIAYNMMRMWQGASGMAEQEAIVSPAYVVLAAKPNLDPRFAAYLFKTPRMIHSFWAYSYGLTNDRLRLYPKDALKVPVEIPPLAEQRKIAEILSTWDRAIETTEALLATARTQKRALMQSLLTGKRRFPEFEGQDWREVRLGDVTDVVTKGTTPTSVGFEFAPEGVNFIKAENISDYGTVLPNKAFISSECHAALRRSQFSDGDILVTIAGAIGRIAIASQEILPANTNQAVALVRLPEKALASRRFLFHWLQSAEIQNIFRSSVTTGAQPNISLRQLSNLPVKYPSLGEQDRIAATLDAAALEVKKASDQIEKLHTEKKALMQQLLTGKRRVQV